eukprot:364814-Chlamydomonas_euryale.AAC.5
MCEQSFEVAHRAVADGQPRVRHQLLDAAACDAQIHMKRPVWASLWALGRRALGRRPMRPSANDIGSEDRDDRQDSEDRKDMNEQLLRGWKRQPSDEARRDSEAHACKH